MRASERRALSSAKRKLVPVLDTFDKKDIGEMILSFFAVLGVFATNTTLPIMPTPVIGLVFVFAVVLILYIAIFLIIDNKHVKDNTEVYKQTAYHITAAGVISLVMTLVLSYVWGYTNEEWWGIEGFLTHETLIAFVVGMSWASVINSLVKD